MGNTIGRRHPSRYGARTLCGQAFKPVPLEHRFITPARPVGTGTRDPTTPETQPPTGITRNRFGLIRFRSPLLTEYPFLQVLRCFTSLRTPRPQAVPAHDGRRVPPFGDPRIKAMLEAPLGLSHPQTSFIGTVCQGIHHTPLQAAQQQTNIHCRSTRRIPDSKIARRQIITLKMITKRSISKPNSKRGVWRNRDKQKETQSFLHCSRPLSSSQTTTRHTFRRTSNGRPGHSAWATDRATMKPLWGGGPGAQKHIRTTPGRNESHPSP